MNHPKKIDALLSLLQDEDRQVSSMAMEELLHLDKDVDQLLAELQETDNPILRGRIHQLSCILKLRRARTAFIDSVRDNSVSLWEGLQAINYQFNPRMNIHDIDRMVEELDRQLPPRLSCVRLASFMRKEKFTFTDEDSLGADLYLIEDVLLQRVGTPILLALLAQKLAAGRDFHTSLVLHKGRHCLLDTNCNLIAPADNWRVTRLSNNERLHPCGTQDAWLTILSQHFVSAVQEGRLHAIHRVGSILAKLCGGEFSKLSFPLGS